jgi:hypothetical protein
LNEFRVTLSSLPFDFFAALAMMQLMAQHIVPFLYLVVLVILPRHINPILYS